MAPTATPNSRARITRPDRIGWQRVHVHLGMPDQRNSLIDSLGPDESVVLLRWSHFVGQFGSEVKVYSGV